jgi:hypothetical protein
MELPTPYDPMCEHFARDMEYLDTYIEAEELADPEAALTQGELREEYVRQNEGTYNPENGHFLCDACYIRAGTPSSPTGWKCP